MAAKNHCTRCSRFSYFATDFDQHGVCKRCRAEAKAFEATKAEYRGKPWNAMDLIHLYWRSNFSVSQVADILDESEDTIRFEIEICRQNAR